jgi:hypothetical protein
VSEILRLSSGLRIDPLLKAIQSKPDLFKEITARQDTAGTYHQDTETIFLRWAQDRSPMAAFTEIPAVDYPAIEKLPEAKDLIEKVLRVLKTKELGRVIIVRFKPKGFIAPHIDEGAYADHYERFHLVLDSDPGNHFMVESEKGKGSFVHMQPDCLYWFNHKKKHSVVNFSDRPRLHMIIDAVVPALKRKRES